MDLFEPWRNAPPPRFSVESDSEEDVDPEDVGNGQGSSGASTSRIARTEPQVELRGEHANVNQLVIAVDQAGQDWAEGFASEALVQSAEVFVDAKKVASISYTQDTAIAFIAGSFSYEAQHALAEKLFELAPKFVTVLDSYSSSSYLSSGPVSPTVRHLSSSTAPALKTRLEAYQPPNIFTGLSAAIASRAQENGIPLHLFLLPSSSASAQTNSTFYHSPLRQSIPETMYDYGGPSPHSPSPLISSQLMDLLRSLGEELGWIALGWNTSAMKEKLGKSGSHSQTESPAGFGWYKEGRRLGQRVIGEGGMYI